MNGMYEGRIPSIGSSRMAHAAFVFRMVVLEMYFVQLKLSV